MTRRRRYPQSSSRRALVSLEQLQRLPLVLEDRVPLRPDDIRARTRRALRCCVVAAANGAPATVSFTLPALPDRGRQQRVAVAEARGAGRSIPEWEPRQAARCGRLTRHPCWRSAQPAPAPRPWTQSTIILALSSSGPKHGGSFPARLSRCCGAEPPSWPAIARIAPRTAFALPSAGLRQRHRDHRDWL